MTRHRHRPPPTDFSEFVAVRSAAMLRCAWLLTGDHGRAEDLLQTALAKAWRHWPRIVAAGPPEAYVRKVLYTTYVSWWRRRWRDELSTAQPPEPTAAGDFADAAAGRDAVRRALARLSRQQRAVVVLRFVEDLSVERTAEVLDCSPGTVKVQTARALKLLRSDPDLALPYLEEVGS